MKEDEGEGKGEEEGGGEEDGRERPVDPDPVVLGSGDAALALEKGHCCGEL